MVNDKTTEGARIEELTDLFRRMPVALYRTSPTGELLAANTALANLLGYGTLEELREGLATVDTVYVDESQRAQWISEISEAGVIHDMDVELRRPDGTTVWVQDTARSIRGDDGKVAFFEGALIDQTEKIKARRARDEFIATVSHELRNPIAVMLGMGEELAKNYDGFSDDERRELARLVATQAEEASWLIEDLLVAYRADIGQVTVSPQDFDITKAAERVLEVVDRPVSVEVLSVATITHADPRRTRQILRNLVSNALRYGGDEVVVRIEPIGDRVELRVCDSGPPIPAHEVERIFRPFEIGTGSQHPKSVGLGLSVARKLARLMEGDLTYRYQGGSSSFVLSLPAA
jgi:PAS domain S-box-containing protein